MSESSLSADQTFPDAVKLLADRPSIALGDIDRSRLLPLLLMFTAPSIFLLFVFFGLGTIAMCLGGTVTAFRMSRIVGDEQTVNAVLAEHKKQLAIILAGLLLGQWLTIATHGEGAIGFIVIGADVL